VDGPALKVTNNDNEQKKEKRCVQLENPPKNPQPDEGRQLKKNKIKLKFERFYPSKRGQYHFWVKESRAYTYNRGGF
jgi:hypothetical protein